MKSLQKSKTGKQTTGVAKMDQWGQLMPNLWKPLKESGPMITSKECGMLTIDKASKSAQISKFKREEPKMLDMLVVKMLRELNIMTSSDWSEDVIVMFAQSVINNFWYLRIEQIALICNKIANGQVKRKYGKLSYSDLAEIIHKFDCDFADFHGDASSRDSDTYKSQSKSAAELFTGKKNELNRD